MYFLKCVRNFKGHIFHVDYWARFRLQKVRVQREAILIEEIAGDDDA
jgi:hypothetical protein